MAWRKLYAYWLDHHLDRRPPSRRDIDPPLQIPELLPNLMLIDVIATGFRLRLVGSELALKAGIDTTGRFVDPTQVPGRDIPAFVKLLVKVVETASPALYQVGRSAEYAYGARGILLPLSGGSNQVEMMLGGFFFELNPLHDFGREWVPGAMSELSLADELARGEQDKKYI